MLGVTLPPLKDGLVDKRLLREAKTRVKKAEYESFHVVWKSAGFPIYLEILLTRLSTNGLIWSGWKVTFALGESSPSSGGKHSGLVSSPFIALQ